MKSSIWWAGRELNPHPFRDTVLSRERIPFRHLPERKKPNLIISGGCANYPEGKLFHKLNNFFENRRFVLREIRENFSVELNILFLKGEDKLVVAHSF